MITDTVTWAARHQCWGVVTDAFDALAAFGVNAQPAHAFVRPLTNAPDEAVRAAAWATLDALTEAPRSARPKGESGYGYGKEPPY